MKTLFFLCLCLVSQLAIAANLEDVSVLDVIPKRDSFELKLHQKDGAKDSYFFVDITKSDPESFEKMGYVAKKLLRGEKYKLNLRIASFSASPNGSYYKSTGILFFGSSVEAK